MRPTSAGVLAEQCDQRLLEVSGGDALEIEDRDQHLSRTKPFEAVRAMMLENLERVGFATQIYIERQVAASRDFGESFECQGFSGGPPHSGRILSIPVEGVRGGCKSDWRKDRWFVQTNGLFSNQLV